MSDARRRLKRRGVLAALLAVVVLPIAASAVTATASAGPTPPTICQRVPTSGLLPPGQTAQTSLQLSNLWQWSASSAHQPFRWQLINRAGTVVFTGMSQGAGGTISVPLDYYRWRVTNLGTVGQYWTVCSSSGP
jgi:hypothetical protein